MTKAKGTGSERRATWTGIWAGSGTELGTAVKGEGEQRSLREGEMQLGLGETEGEKPRGKKAQVWWAEESGHFGLSPLWRQGRIGAPIPLSAQCSLHIDGAS